MEQGLCVLQTVAVFDKSAQSPALTVFLFNASPTLTSTNGQAISIADAEMAKCVGHFTVASGNWETVAAGSMACVKPVLYLHSATVGGTLYAVAKVTGTPTFTSTSDLIFQYTFTRV